MAADLSSRKRILLVDDDADNLESLGSYLQANLPDSDVEEASDPRAALERARQERFDVLIVDQRMPHMTGAQLIAAVGKRAGLFRILITSQAITNIAPEGKPDVLIQKPFDLAFLLRKIKETLAASS